ncbi:MAG TPA: winged helix-turn-helix domain-containing protein [Trebonia sp.]|nr:winged helix-turn-helix domain-containing protein [Trebonia sp.]
MATPDDVSALPDPRRYRQMASDIRALIVSGQIVPGAPAPTISELSVSYHAARQTCAKALQLLVKEGLLARYPGAGYYVISNRPR